MRLEIHLRQEMAAKHEVLLYTAAILVAFILGALAMALAGLSPWKVYATIFNAAFFGGVWALSDTAVKAVPLILCGIGCALAFRAGLWNVGAEGQLLLGAWAATGVASFWIGPELSPWIKIPLILAAGTAAGALWGLVPAFLKTRYRVSEILSSLMLVYVAVQWNTYWIYAPWSDRGFQLTPRFPLNALLPRLSDAKETFPALSGLTIHLGLPIALIGAMAVGLLMQRSRWGIAWRAMGENPNAARTAGLDIATHVLLVMTLSGAAAGLAGAIEVTGVVHRLQERFSPGFGFTAIAVAWLARLNPWATILTAFAFGGILVGAKQVGSQGISMLLQGTLLSVMILFEGIRRYKITLHLDSDDSGEAP